MKRKKARKWNICDCRKINEYFREHHVGEFEKGDSGFILNDGAFVILPRGYIHTRLVGEAMGYKDPMTFKLDACRKNSYLKQCGGMYVRDFADDTFAVESIGRPTVEEIKTLVKYMKEGDYQKIQFYGNDSPDVTCLYEKKYPRPMDVQTWVSRCWE